MDVTRRDTATWRRAQQRMRLPVITTLQFIDDGLLPQRYADKVCSTANHMRGHGCRHKEEGDDEQGANRDAEIVKMDGQGEQYTAHAQRRGFGGNLDAHEPVGPDRSRIPQPCR